MSNGHGVRSVGGTSCVDSSWEKSGLSAGGERGASSQGNQEHIRGKGRGAFLSGLQAAPSLGVPGRVSPGCLGLSRAGLLLRGCQCFLAVVGDELIGLFFSSWRITFYSKINVLLLFLLMLSCPPRCRLFTARRVAGRGGTEPGPWEGICGSPRRDDCPPPVTQGTPPCRSA